MRSSSAVLEIDLGKIQQNYQILSKICNKAKVASAVKANAYGLGATKIAPVLQDAGCKDFFVANIEEGVELRDVLKEDANIYILNGIFYDDIEAFNEYTLIPVLNYLDQVSIWQEYASSINRQLPCIMHINTGMNRLGMDIEEMQKLTSTPELLNSLNIKYIMSHLAASEDQENPYNQFQLEKFKDCLKYFPDIQACFANSSGIFLGSDYHFDLVRPGIALYGGNPTLHFPNPMQNTIRLIAPIIQLRELPPGSSVGYNMTFLTNRDTIIATLPIGYADGYSRKFSGCGEVFIGGFKANVVGRISMDLITVDVTDLPREKIFIGAEAEIIGDYCTIDKIAAIKGTISYEVLTSLGNRYKRIYK